jgi:hypothetical protein
MLKRAHFPFGAPEGDVLSKKTYMLKKAHFHLSAPEIGLLG